ncbi:MAG: bifunctional siderophore receptor/adhesin Iha [Sideroxydans sp.]
MKRSCLILALMPVFAHAELQPALQEITVTATQEADAARRDATSQKVVIGRKDIENMGVMTIGEVLGKLPGVEVQGEGQRARGMSRDSVQILVDGERPAGGSRIVAGVIGRLPAGDLERVEILRGTSAEYGGASAITVNLVLKKAISRRKTELKAVLGLRGSEPTGQFTWTESGGEGGFGWTLPFTANLHRSPAGGSVERLDQSAGTTTLHQRDDSTGLFTFRELVMSPRFTWKQGGDSFTLAPLLFDGLGRRDTDMRQFAATPATSTTLSANGDRITHEENRRKLLRLRAEGEQHLGGHKLTYRAALNQGSRTVDTTRTAHDAFGNVTLNQDSTRADDHEFNFAVRLDRPLNDAHLLAVGLEHARLTREDRQSLSGVAGNYLASERQSALWMQDDWSLADKVVFTPGLRLERVTLDTGSSGQNAMRVQPSLALRWEATPQWLLRTSIGAGMKMPRLDEISAAAVPSVGVNTPLEADQRGNPNLRAEHNVNFEAIAERYLADEAGLLGINFYARRTQDFIERRVQLEGTRWVERPQNEGTALHWGWEMDGKLRTDGYGWKGATLKAHLTLPHARVEDARLGIARMARDTPRYVFSAGLDQSLPSLASSYSIALKVSGRSVTDIPGETYAVREAIATLDASWLYKLSSMFNLRISGQNLLAADTVQESRYLNGSNVYTLHARNNGYASLLVTLEGRW